MPKNDDGSEPREARGYRQYAKDGGLVLGVGLLLTVIHVVLPESIKAELAFDHAQFNVWGLYTSAFVQYSDLQLAGNVVGYLLAVSFTYWLVLEAEVRNWFRRTFYALLLALPPFVVLSSYGIAHHGFGIVLPPERGFSGVASGFGGFLLVALVIYLRHQYNPALGNSAGATVLLLLLVEIDSIYSAGFDPRVVGLATGGILLVMVGYLWEYGLDTSLDSDYTRRVKPVVISGLVVVVLSAITAGMFPADPFKDGSFTNIFGHAAGFVWGSFIALGSYEIPSGNE